MEELMKRQNSTAVFQKYHSGCMWGLFEFMDFHRHLHVRNMLSYNKKSGDGKHTAGIKPPMSAKSNLLSEKENGILDKEANLLVQDKGPVRNKRPGRSFLRTLISRKESKKKDEKQKIAPSVSHLSRSLPIHYLESDEYVLPDDMTSFSEFSAAEINPHDIVPSLNSQHEPLSPKVQSGKWSEVCSTMSNAAHEGHNQLNEIQNCGLEKHETILNVLQDPNDTLTDCQLDPLTSCGKQKNSGSFVNQEDKLRAAETDSSPGIVESKHSERKNQDRDEVATSHFKTLRQRVKDVIKENKKGSHRISRDGVLDKIPYGQKVSEDFKKEKLGLSEWRNLSRSGRGNVTSKFGIGGPSLESLRRSQSLHESVDRYTRLLEPSSASELNKLPQKPSVVEDDVLQDKKSGRIFGRILSSPEIRFHVSTVALLDRDGEFETFFSEEPKRTSNLVPPEAVDLETFAESITESIETIHGVPQQPVANEHDDIGTCEIPDTGRDKGGQFHPVEQETGIEVAYSDDSTTVSVFDSCFQEGPVSPAKNSLLKAGSAQEPIHSDEVDSFTTPEEQSCYNFSSGVETINTGDDKVLMPGAVTDQNAVFAQVDEKDEAEFIFVKEMLRKSGLTDELSTKEPSVFGEAEGSPHYINAAMDDEIEKSPEHQLLFDLINESLLELYESSSCYWPGFSHLNSRIRSIPTGQHVLEEIWTRITQQLHFQPQPNATLDDYVARDYTKNDGWMNLRGDTEFIGLELEDSIFDDLLDEIILAV